MKLSQLTTKQALGKVLKLTPVIKELLGDKQLLAIWKRGYDIAPNSTAEEIEVAKSEASLNKVMDLLTYGIEKHETNIYKILSIMEDKTIKEIQSQPLSVTIMQLKELLEDKDFMGLFIS